MQDPFDLFGEWLQEAEKTEPNDPNAMALATVDERGAPSLRMVLLKGHGPDGFVFYTNLESRKGQELLQNPHVALLFHWKSLRRQIRIEGMVCAVSEEEADEYFASRPRMSQIGAWASQQSRPLSSLAKLEAEAAACTARFGVSKIPRPPHWSGFRVTPERFEFWRDGKFRLHDRTHYQLSPEKKMWVTQKLYP